MKYLWQNPNVTVAWRLTEDNAAKTLSRYQYFLVTFEDEELFKAIHPLCEDEDSLYGLFEICTENNEITLVRVTDFT